MKKRISIILVGSSLLTSFNDVKADLLKEQKEKLESFITEDSIMNNTTGKRICETCEDSSVLLSGC